MESLHGHCVNNLQSRLIVDKKKYQKLEEAGYLSGVQDDGDLPLENNKHHRVLVCAAHSLGRVALDPEERS